MSESAAVLWENFSDAVWRFARSRVASDADADDVVQDVFVKVLSRSDQLRDDERIAGWIFRIASNAVVDHHRSSRVLPQRASHQPVDPPSLEIDQFALLAQCVRPFVEALDPTYRDALIMTEFEGLTQAEAAERAGISLSGMKSRVQRGRERLRGSFERCCEITLDSRNAVLDVDPRQDCCT